LIALYGMSSPNVTKIVIMLEELGKDFTFRHVEVFRGRQFDPAFAAISPFGKVPVLVDGATGTTVFESAAILIYLAETYAPGILLPASGAERYAVLQWLVAQAAAVGPTRPEKPFHADAERSPRLCGAAL
jgi:GST-like protein